MRILVQIFVFHLPILCQTAIIHGDGGLIYVYSYMGVLLLIFLSKVPRMLSNKSNLQKGYLTPEQCAHTMTPRARSNFSNATRGIFCFEKLQIYVFVGETYFHSLWARSDPCYLLKPQTSKY